MIEMMATTSALAVARLHYAARRHTRTMDKPRDPYLVRNSREIHSDLGKEVTMEAEDATIHLMSIAAVTMSAGTMRADRADRDLAWPAIKATTWTAAGAGPARTWTTTPRVQWARGSIRTSDAAGLTPLRP